MLAVILVSIVFRVLALLLIWKFGLTADFGTSWRSVSAGGPAKRIPALRRLELGVR